MKSPITIFLLLSHLLFQAAAAIADTSAGYRLGPGDSISVQVYGEPDLSLSILLTESGSINYPFLGEIAVKGLTPSGLETRIIEGLKDGYLVDPSVTVSLVQHRQVFIYGEVQVPGGYGYQPGLTVGKATALAQGLTERASEKRIFLLREGADQSEKFRADMTTKLYPGDTITVEQGFF